MARQGRTVLKPVRDPRLRSLNIDQQLSEKHWPERCGNCRAPFQAIEWDNITGFRCTSCGATDSTDRVETFEEAIQDPDYFQEQLFGG